MAFIVKPVQIFLKKTKKNNFYTNVSWVVLYQTDDFSAQCSFWSVAMATEMK